MLVKDIMTRRVKVVFEDTPFKKVAYLIFKKKFSGVPVVDKERNVVGIVSEKDLLQALFPSYQELVDELFHDILKSRNFEEIEKRIKDVSSIKARDLMNKKVITVEPETHIMEACAKMILNRVRRLPVVKRGRLIGIISQGDVFRAILKYGLKIKESNK